MRAAVVLAPANLRARVQRGAQLLQRSIYRYLDLEAFCSNVRMRQLQWECYNAPAVHVHVHAHARYYSARAPGPQRLWSVHTAPDPPHVYAYTTAGLGAAAGPQPVPVATGPAAHGFAEAWRPAPASLA